MTSNLKYLAGGIALLALAASTATLATSGYGIAWAASHTGRSAHARTAKMSSSHAPKGWKKIDQWMIENVKAKRVKITVIAAENGANSGFNLDGYAKGRANYVVPLGWTVTISFSNHSAVLPHSLGIASGHGNNAALPQIDGKKVQIPDARSGVHRGTTETLTFKAQPAGKYFFICEVPGHDTAGMWDHFTIEKATVKPSVLVH